MLASTNECDFEYEFWDIYYCTSVLRSPVCSTSSGKMVCDDSVSSKNNCGKGGGGGGGGGSSPKSSFNADNLPIERICEFFCGLETRTIRLP